MKSRLSFLLCGTLLFAASCSNDSGSDLYFESEPEGIGQGCNIDFNSGTISDDVGYVKYADLGETCNVYPSLNPIAVGRVFEEYLGGQCVQFIVGPMNSVRILDFC